MSKFLHDAQRFILKSRHIAEIAPLQLYSSGLVFAPMKSIIREKFGTEMFNWICTLPEVEEFWGAELQTLEGHSCSVYSVAFSHDGKTLASGSLDQTIKLWDVHTGEEKQTLKGHSDLADSVAFSNSTPSLPSRQVSLEQGWVAFRGTKLLWLPSEYCAFSSWTTKDGALAIGYIDGRVLIMRFMCL